MSFVFRDPFFDAFDDFVNYSVPSYVAIGDDKDNKKDAVQKVRRDVITPFSGFGRMDLHENDKSYEMKVDIPGMKKEDIKLTTEENKLVIEGERKDEKDDKCHFVERHFGSFHREVCLPVNAEMDKISASYENGVLSVSVPKKEEVKPAKKQITVN